MNFILDAQAKAEVRMAQHDEWMAKLAEAMVKHDDAIVNHEEWLAKHEKAVVILDKQLKATANLLRGAIRYGARELPRLKEEQRVTADRAAEQQRVVADRADEQRRITDQKFAELAESQRITDETFRAFMRSFGKSTNGN
jgi:hypothetical protein